MLTLSVQQHTPLLRLYDPHLQQYGQCKTEWILLWAAPASHPLKENSFVTGWNTARVRGRLLNKGFQHTPRQPKSDPRTTLRHEEKRMPEEETPQRRALSPFPARGSEHSLPRRSELTRMCLWMWQLPWNSLSKQLLPSPSVISATERPHQDTVLTMHIFLVSFQSLDDASVSFQAALPQLIQVIHHIIVRLKRQQESMYEQCPWWSVHLLVYDFNELQSTLLPHLINLCLGSLLEGIQYNVQVLFKFSSNSKGNITKHRENLWLHRPMNVFILEEISAPLHSAALF